MPSAGASKRSDERRLHRSRAAKLKGKPPGGVDGRHPSAGGRIRTSRGVVSDWSWLCVCNPRNVRESNG
nr:MAG TPA: hypothetical protein [Caudoviricetes sp.]